MSPVGPTAACSNFQGDGLNLPLRVWRQAAPDADGAFETHQARDVSPNISFREMPDVVNERLTGPDQPPIAFEDDCARVFVARVA